MAVDLHSLRRARLPVEATAIMDRKLTILLELDLPAREQSIDPMIDVRQGERKPAK